MTESHDSCVMTSSMFNIELIADRCKGCLYVVNSRHIFESKTNLAEHITRQKEVINHFSAKTGYDS